MTEIDGNALIVVQTLPEAFGCRNVHALLEFFLADGHHLDGFHQIVAELTVEGMLHLPQLPLAFLGKTFAEIQYS